MKIQEWKLFFFPNPQRNIYTIATIICLVLILLQAILTVYFWFHAPLRIPIHYNMKGLPDRYGNKNNIWSLLLISTVLFILLTGLIRSKFIYKNFKGAPEDFGKIDVKPHRPSTPGRCGGSGRGRTKWVAKGWRA